MSYNTERIRKAAAAAGLKVEKLYWEPVGPAAEKCGNSGGWVLLFDTQGDPGLACESPILAYNVDSVLAQIQRVAARCR